MKTKQSITTKAKRLVARMSRAELKELNVAIYARQKKIREQEIAATCESAMEAAEGFLQSGEAVMINPKRVGVSETGIIPGAKLYVRKVHRGRKHFGVWVSPEPTSLSKSWRWIRAHSAADLVPFVDMPEERAAAAALTKSMSRLFGAVP